jgi:hypothetical protein
MKPFITIMIAALALLVSSCKKEAGVGGDAEIKGTVWTYQLNGSLTDTVADYAGADVYVYIVYGDNTGFDKRVKTDYNGDFRFSYLYPGDYTIYAYTFNPQSVPGQEPVIRKITIESRDEVVEVERINIVAEP